MISEFIFIGGIHGVFLTWTAILVIFAYFDYRKLSMNVSHMDIET